MGALRGSRTFPTTRRSRSTGDEPKKRVTLGAVTSRVRRFHTTLGAASALRSLKKVSQRATDEEKAPLRAEIDAVAAWVVSARQALRG